MGHRGTIARGLTLVVGLLLVAATVAAAAVTHALVQSSEHQVLARRATDGTSYVRALLTQTASPVLTVATGVASSDDSLTTFQAVAERLEAARRPSSDPGTPGLRLTLLDGASVTSVVPVGASTAVDETAAGAALASGVPQYSSYAGPRGFRGFIVTAPVPGMDRTVVQGTFAPFDGTVSTALAFDDLAFALYAGTRIDPAQTLATFGTSTSSTLVQQGFELYGMQFTVTFQPRGNLVSSATRALPWYVLGGGLLVSLVVVTSVEALRRGRQRALLVVAERTAALDRLAHFDDLTALPNRRLLLERLDQALGQMHVAVLYIDVDHFKTLNDAHGHEGGDRVLVEVASRLAQSVRAGDTVARLGGDEFVAVCLGVTSVAQADELGARVADTLEQPITLATGVVVPSVSIGVYLASVTDTVASSLRGADGALYSAKDGGRGRHALRHSLDG